MSDFLAFHLTPSQIITDIMAICMVLGAIDYFRGNKWGIGEKFTEAFDAFSSLALTMVGIITIVPLIQTYLVPFISPLFSAIGVDPAMVAGMVLANDTGGYQLAHAIASNPQAGNLSGMLLASMLGVNIVFNLPVALGIIKTEDRVAMAKGMSCGFVTIPFGCLIGALVAGYNFTWTVINLIPVFFVSIIIAILLRVAPNAVAKVFIVFGKIIMAIALLGTVVGIFSHITGIAIPGLAPVSEGFNTVVAIIMILPGAYVLVHILTKILNKPFGKLGKLLGTDSSATIGLVTTVANAIPTFSMVKNMDERGKIINFAFIVSGSYLLGDHLAFCTALDKSFVMPLLIGKLSAGVLAVGLAILLTKNKEKRK